ncbi:prepilin peptidase [Thermosediminibacter litoriperuensis]|uniref:Leader peptidase (Prepilin peptidase)/N-methyltransferase n=1 Tax=Thermosediminibacter litoriperuensis TaxID=291989 RepID=A0A5S5AVS2_9FIRM|nr:prepilin peptidase [Thermosediminibacter litoriperuensis]TYP56828.1 leader peptidase (prepilin peptidase)/N-methyltransferase [Thermosediminibacter litoriperuensis]
MEAIKIRYVPVIVLLGYLSYVDLKRREVPDLAVLALFIYSLLACRNLKEGLITGGLVFIVHLSAAVISGGSIGGGDIKLMSVLAFLLGWDFFLMVLPMAGLMTVTLVYALVTGKGLRYSIPLVPYLFASFLVSWGCFFER